MNFLRLKMDVVDSAIMREVAVPEDFTLAFLHGVIQSIFGWLDYHMHEFTDAEGIRYGDRDCEPPDDDLPFKFDDDVPMRRLFKKRGDKLKYEYDFGDLNEIQITLVGKTSFAQLKHFATKGPDMVEDCASLGYTEGVVDKLKNGSASEKHEIASWLMAAFHKSPKQVMREPDAREIFYRVYRMVKFVDTAQAFYIRNYYHDCYEAVL